MYFSNDQTSLKNIDLYSLLFCHSQQIYLFFFFFNDQWYTRHEIHLTDIFLLVETHSGLKEFYHLPDDIS